MANPLMQNHPVQTGSGNGHMGQAHAMRGPGTLRQPYLDQVPKVSSAAGFGTGSGAGITNEGSDADQSQGIVAIRVGLAPAASGTIVLNFPVAPTGGQYWATAEWCSIVPSVAGNNLTLTWTGTRPLVTGELLRLAYQWNIST